MRIINCVIALLVLTTSLFAQSPSTQPAQPGMATPEQKAECVAASRERMARDSKKYAPGQLKEAENLYQVANKLWKSEEGKTALKTMIEKYPDINRTGCAVLYLGQMTRGEEKENYLKQAIEKFSDCYYGDGTQVGGLARLFLAATYKEAGKADDAEKLLAEIEKDYAGAIDHSGRLIVASVEKVRAVRAKN